VKRKQSAKELRTLEAEGKMITNTKLLLVGLIGLTLAALSAKSAPSAAPGDASLFTALLPVLKHPRCLNCHSAGDFPRQGDGGHPHGMNVRRGVGGLGVTAQKCGACHQDHNVAGQHMPPGAPGWRLPPAAMPMIWQGKSDGEICNQIKDPKQNGHRTVAQIVEHMTADKLVLWGWEPGEGRNPVSMGREEFAAKLKAWAAGGAPCPAR
jgi:hypothetical protein